MLGNFEPKHQRALRNMTVKGSVTTLLNYGGSLEVPNPDTFFKSSLNHHISKTEDTESMGYNDGDSLLSAEEVKDVIEIDSDVSIDAPAEKPDEIFSPMPMLAKGKKFSAEPEVL